MQYNEISIKISNPEVTVEPKLQQVTETKKKHLEQSAQLSSG